MLAAVAAAPAAPGRPVVVELFTSQGCSSCPPAEAFLSELARDRADVLALSWHVTYWNGLGWPDPFSLPAATDRQRRYAALLPADVYTPQMVVDGTADVVGFDRGRALAAIAAAAAAHRGGPALAVSCRAGQATITLGAGEGVADILVLGYDREHRTAVGSGENEGRTLTGSNIVRALATVGTWRGVAQRIVVPVPQGERLAVLLQAPDGRMLGVA
jgi:hypothetical protein